MDLLKNFLRDEEGVTAIEYALVAAVLATVVVTVFDSSATAVIQAVFDKVKSAITGTSTAG
ncbi:MAG: Flp/Fap pilin component [Pseudomonadota bacterium]|nr:Flp/Fap pilin component [Pseudomonadota bacterium]